MFRIVGFEVQNDFHQVVDFPIRMEDQLRNLTRISLAAFAALSPYGNEELVVLHQRVYIDLLRVFKIQALYVSCFISSTLRLVLVGRLAEHRGFCFRK